MQITVNKNNPPIPHRDFFSDIIGKKQFVVSWYPKYKDDIKKRGTLRTGTFDLKSRKWWKRTDGTYYVPKRKHTINDWVHDIYVRAFDLDKKDYRYINYDTIKYIQFGRQRWSVEIKNKKSEKLITMKLLNKKVIH